MSWKNWESVKHIKDCKTIVGSILFEKLFDKCPNAKFGFPIDLDVNLPDLLQSKHFIAQATYFWGMVDTSLIMLSPDIKLLMEIMTELGTKHTVYGNLGKAFTEDYKASWKETYGALSLGMIHEMVSK